MGFYTVPASTVGQTVLTNSAQSANFTASANVIYSVNASSAAVTVTLPTSAAYQSIIVKKTDSSTNTVTLSGTINGVSSATYVLTRQYQIKQLYADGSGGWNIVSGDSDMTVISASTATTGFLPAVGLAKLTVGTTAPSSPAVGDIWIDTN